MRESSGASSRLTEALCGHRVWHRGCCSRPHGAVPLAGKAGVWRPSAAHHHQPDGSQAACGTRRPASGRCHSAGSRRDPAVAPAGAAAAAEWLALSLLLAGQLHLRTGVRAPTLLERCTARTVGAAVVWNKRVPTVHRATAGVESCASSCHDFTVLLH